MPRYDMFLVLKSMQRPETAATLRRIVENLFEHGAMVRSMENLGERRLPYAISKHGSRHKHGGYFAIDFYSSPTILKNVLDNLERDIDVLRPTIVKNNTERPPKQCHGVHEKDPWKIN
ncbi:hypothetical protein DNTS_035637 [Danionella cerebrum]|uniref:Small ribosomal subunit protein bS6m n=1 Tax=Danionella cerebrum TaxID=2873325 RepID=A0A553R9F7_9TELE|nr:hypothetical protein DNTS_035637 [Danionella translucida]